MSIWNFKAGARIFRELLCPLSVFLRFPFGFRKDEELLKSQIFRFAVIPTNPGSRLGKAPKFSHFNMFWMPDPLSRT